MIPADVAARLRLVLPEQPAPTQPVVPSPQIQDVLSDLVPGQRILAEIQALLPNGNYRAAIAQREITLALPFSAKPGDSLELEVIERGNRLVLAVVAEKAPASATQRESVSATLSPAGRLIGELLGRIGEPGEKAAPAVLNASRPLLAAPPQGTADLAPLLREALTHSGLFYESHQARWVAGQLPAAALQLEPQGKFSSAPATPGSPPGATHSSADGAVPLPTLTPQPSASPRTEVGGPLPPPTETGPQPTSLAREATAAGTIPSLPASLVPLVQQQLDALATQVFHWQGQVWPGQNLEWAIDDSPSSRTPSEDAASPSWTTRLKLTLPRLGSVEATLRLLGGDQVQLAIATADPATAASLQGGRAALAHQFADAGLNLDRLDLSHADSAG